MYITCRSEFFDQWVQPTRGSQPRDVDREAVLRLAEFDDGDVVTAIADQHRLQAVLADPESRTILSDIFRKPLILRILAEDQDDVETLLERSHENGRRLSEYDVFDLLFERWRRGILGSDFTAKLTRPLYARLSSQHGPNSTA